MPPRSRKIALVRLAGCQTLIFRIITSCCMGTITVAFKTANLFFFGVLRGRVVCDGVFYVIFLWRVVLLRRTHTYVLNVFMIVWNCNQINDE